MPNWELKNCCQHDQVAFLVTVGVYTFAILADYMVDKIKEHGLFLVSNKHRVISDTKVKSIPRSSENDMILEYVQRFSNNFNDLFKQLWRTFLLTPFKLITVFLHEASHAIACLLTCGRVEGIQVHANEGGVTQTRGGIYWIILPAGYLGSSFWGMVLILASLNIQTARIAAGCFGVALLIVLFIAKNWTLRGLCIGFIIFLAVVWVLQEMTTVRVLRYVILFIGVMNSLFSVYDIYDDLISRRVNSSDAEKFAEICPCPCNGAAWGVIWGMISFIFLAAALYLGLVILS